MLSTKTRKTKKTNVKQGSVGIPSFPSKSLLTLQQTVSCPVQKKNNLEELFHIVRNLNVSIIISKNKFLFYEQLALEKESIHHKEKTMHPKSQG